jgi:V/A-type H+-transporting ATPase subunit A
MIGTVSPAGGNLKNRSPSRRSELSKLSSAFPPNVPYKRFYPAVDPLLPWSRYHAQLATGIMKTSVPTGCPRVEEMIELLAQGAMKSRRMMQVTGEEGVSTEDFVRSTEGAVPRHGLPTAGCLRRCRCLRAARPPASRPSIWSTRLPGHGFEFPDKDAVRKFFTEQTSLFKNLNYAADGSQERQQLLKRIETGVHAAPQRLTD